MTLVSAVKSFDQRFRLATMNIQAAHHFPPFFVPLPVTAQRMRDVGAHWNYLREHPTRLEEVVDRLSPSGEFRQPDDCSGTGDDRVETSVDQRRGESRITFHPGDLAVSARYQRGALGDRQGHVDRTKTRPGDRVDPMWHLQERVTSTVAAGPRQVVLHNCGNGRSVGEKPADVIHFGAHGHVPICLVSGDFGLVLRLPLRDRPELPF